MRNIARHFLLPAVFFFVALPIAVHGAEIVDLIRTPDEEIVTRGDFIRAAVKAMGTPAPKAGTQLPSKRPVPASLVPTMTAAYARGALGIFGDDLLPAKGITRGEAVYVLSKLFGGTAVNEDTGYTDVPRTSVYAQAVEIAVAQHWIEPLKEDFFGVQRGLVGREARVLLRKVGGEQAQIMDETDNSATTMVRLHGKSARLPKEEVLEYMWQLIQENYVHKDKVDQDKIAEKMAQALAESLDDAYTIYMPPPDAKGFQTQLGRGEQLTGIGAQVEFKNTILTIVAPMPGSPAEKAKLQAGDEIIAVNGESLTGLTFTDAVNKVRGPKGSTAKLRIRRNGSEIDVSVIRDTIVVTDFQVTEQSGIPVVKFSIFGEMADRELRQTFTALNAKHPKGIIIDLRNNPGGLLSTADTFLSNFLPKGSVTALIKSTDGQTQEVTDEDPTVDNNVKLIILINKGSASASELSSAALQDYKRATVIGENSFGKGSVQRFWDFSDGSIFKLTVAEYMSPLGRKVDGVGVKPDIEIMNAATADRDEALLKAVEMMR